MAVEKGFPHFKGKLREPWRCVSSWQEELPRRPRVPIPEPLLRAMCVLTFYFGLVVMPVVCALIGPKSRREAVVEKEDLEAVTDAPISVSGGAPTAENSI